MAARARRRMAIGLAIGFGLGVTLSLAFLLNFLSGAQAQSTDVLFKVRPDSSLSQFSRRIAIVAMDDRSLAQLGYWVTWDRSYYARLIRLLSGARARVVALDVAFEQPKPGDDELAKAIAEAGMVIQPVSGNPNVPEVTRSGELVRFQSRVAPQPELAAAGAGLGHANVLTDGDGTVRRVPLVVRAGDGEYPSLGVAAASTYLRRPKVLDSPPSTPYLRALGRMIPVDRFYQMIVNYAGKPSLPNRPSTFTTVSFVDVLEGRVDSSVFEDKIVFVGLLGATGFADDYWVPTAEASTGKMAGVEIHANVATTVLSNYFLSPQGQPVTVATVLLLALACAALAAVLSPLLAALGTAVVAAFYMLFAFAMFDHGSVVNVVYPQLAILLSFVGVTVYRMVFEEAEQRATVKAMGQYLSPAVMQEILKDPGKLALGGQKREMTVLFSDIRGFTSFSEQLDPQQLVHLLNEYLTAMTEVVFEHGGVLDKYMGDAIMAFWGAPMPQPDHPVLACETALGMLQQLRALHARWEQEGIPRLNIGIGINTGFMSVGNMGSSRRFDYTVMGDAVNLGSRLEGTNKEYGTNVVISKETWERVRGAGFVARFLDRVVVKGKKEPVAIYELLGRDELAPHIAEMLRRYEGALELYHRRDWIAAEAAFAASLESSPEDGPSKLYLERCRKLRLEPPPPEWDGIYAMKSK